MATATTPVPPEFLAAADLLAARAPDSKWRGEARPEQLPPDGDWFVRLILAGRGWGKTWAGAHWLAEEAIANPGDYAVIGRSEPDVKQTCIEGTSGLLAALGLTRDSPQYRRGTAEIRLDNGSTIRAYSAESPEQLRGPNLSGAWLDEFAAWRFGEQIWTETLVPAVRVGRHPRICVTTTPRPTKILRELLSRTDGSVVVTKGSSYDNPTLSASALGEWKRRYEGSRIGRQELYGELLADVEGALWSLDTIDANRVDRVAREDLVKVAIGVDPAMAGGVTGIVACGVDAQGQGFVLGDYSIAGTPDQWARRVVATYQRHEANAVICEINQGGALVTQILRTVDPSLPIKTVRAAVGKSARAAPWAALSEQGRISHVGVLPELEDQLCCWTGQGASPDRLDAMCWGFEELKPGENATAHGPCWTVQPTESRWAVQRPGQIFGSF